MQDAAIRVVVFTNILPPYRIPLYQCLAENPLLNVTTVLLAENEANREWELDTRLPFVRLLPGRSLYLWRWELPIHVNHGLMGLLGSSKPDVLVIGGWDQLAYWVATWWATLKHVPIVLQNESSLDSATHMTGIWLRVKRRMVRAAATYVAYGTKAKEYLVALGADPSRISVGLDTVDVEWFASEAAEWLDTEHGREEHSRKLRVLYVGQLIRRKAVDLLLRAVSDLQRHDIEIALTIVGNGPEEQHLQSLSRQLSLKDVAWEGFKQPHELPKYYASADVLVLPSLREVWGLVANEALASGVYVVCSDRVGASVDVIKPGWNGEVFVSGDSVALSNALRRALGRLDEIRGRRTEIMKDARERLSIAQEADALISAIGMAVHASQPTRG